MQPMSSPAENASPVSRNVYRRTLELLLDRAISDMNDLQAVHDTTGLMLPPSQVSDIQSIWSTIRFPWLSFVDAKKKLDGMQSALSSSNDPHGLQDLQSSCISWSQQTLTYIRTHIRNSLRGNRSEAAQKLILISDQILLWWNILYYAEDDVCDLILLPKNGDTEIEFFVDFKFPTGNVDPTDLAISESSATSIREALPSFTSLEEFSEFCFDSNDAASSTMARFLGTELVPSPSSGQQSDSE
jgi:hypothetical protein